MLGTEIFFLPFIDCLLNGNKIVLACLVIYLLMRNQCNKIMHEAENHGSGVFSECTSGQLPIIRPNTLTLPECFVDQ